LRLPLKQPVVRASEAGGMETALLFLAALRRATVQSYNYVSRRPNLVLGALLTVPAVAALGLLLPPVHTALAAIGFALYWLALGILSSIGLGSGLATFVWFLAPLVAHTALNDRSAPVLAILNQVKFETFWWGLGTALGELPPYFVARAARRSGQKVTQLLENEEQPAVPTRRLSRRLSQNLSVATDENTGPWRSRFLAFLEQHVGFWTILVAASIPNPLFDIWGLYAGYFLVPFGQFFAAVAIGKALVKNFLQAAAVALVFSDSNLENRIDSVVGQVLPPKWADVVGDLINNQVQALSGTGDQERTAATEILSYLWQILLSCMLLWFVLSVVYSTAEYERQLQEKESSNSATPEQAELLSS